VLWLIALCEDFQVILVEVQRFSLISGILDLWVYYMPAKNQAHFLRLGHSYIMLVSFSFAVIKTQSIVQPPATQWLLPAARLGSF